jgi:hypothetical protein
MAERRSLVEGIKPPPPAVDPSVEKDFVFRKPAGTDAIPAVVTAKKQTSAQIPRVPISTRIKTEFAQALKRASLERQLAGMEPSTLQDILEEAVEPWLRTHGYLSQ